MIIFNTVPFLSLSPGLSLLKISSEGRFISICKTISKFTPKNSKKRSVQFLKNARFLRDKYQGQPGDRGKSGDRFRIYHKQQY